MREPSSWKWPGAVTMPIGAGAAKATAENRIASEVWIFI
jgi:hypothetical protein